MWLLHTPPQEKPNEWKIRPVKDGVQFIAKNFKDLSPLMERVGQYLKSVSLVAFANQRFDKKEWPARKTPSIMGIVEDLSRGPYVSDERFKSRKALVNTGNLRRSLSIVVSPKTVRITSNMPYATLHNEGGLNILPITATTRRNLSTFLKSHPSLRSSLGFLFRKWEVEANIPQRQFMGMPESSRPKIEEIAKKYFDDLAKQAPEGEQHGNK